MAGSYTIGTIKIGSAAAQTIYGINNVSSLTLENGATSGSNVEYNPILKFTETGVTNPYEITLEGTRGIQIKKNGKKVEFVVVNKIATNSTKYLNINNAGEFEAVIGSITSNGNTSTLNHGLTDYEEFSNLRSNLYLKGANFSVIDNSLKDTTKDFYYGSTDMIAAITLTI